MAKFEEYFNSDYFQSVLGVSIIEGENSGCTQDVSGTKSDWYHFFSHVLAVTLESMVFGLAPANILG